LISLFRNNLIVNSILLLPYILILRLKSFFIDSPYIPIEGDSFLAKQFYSVFDTVFLQAISTILILFFNAIIINRIVIKKNLSKENNLVAGLLYGLFNSILLGLLPSSPALLCTFFVLLSLQEIFSAYNNMKAADQVFFTGFYMCVAFLLYWPCIIFFIGGYIGLTIIKSFRPVEQIQYLSGWLAPLFLVQSIQYFVMDKFPNIPFYFYSKLKINLFQNLPLSEFLSISFMMILVIIAIFSYGRYIGRKVIVCQKIFSILFWIMLLTGISALFFVDIKLNHLHILLIPISIFLMNNLIEFKNPIIAEMIHLVLILMLVVVHLDLINLT
jgi:hypothetical protein